MKPTNHLPDVKQKNKNTSVILTSNKPNRWQTDLPKGEQPEREKKKTALQTK